MATILDLAQALNGALTRDERSDGTKYTHLREGSPAWMTDVIRDAHCDGSAGINGEPGEGYMLPDDIRYEFIAEAVQAIIDNEGDEEQARDGIEADIYTSELTAWLASRNDRYSYCDKFVNEFGTDTATSQGFDTLKVIAGGQWLEKREVFDRVWSALDSLADDDEDSDEDSDSDE